MRYPLALKCRPDALTVDQPLARLSIKRLETLSVDKKVGLVAAVGFASLLIVGGMASHVVKEVKLHSDATDRTHAVLIELTALDTNIDHMERLERDLTLDRVTLFGAYAEARRNAEHSITALERLLPPGSPRRVVLRDMARLIDQQQAPSLVGEAADSWNPDAPLAQSPVSKMTGSQAGAIAVLVDDMWEAERSELEHSKAVEQEGFRRISAGAMIIGIVGCLPGVLLLILLRQDAIMQRRAASALALANDQLDLKVQERTAELAAANDRLRELTARMEAAREEERMHIAREVHDELGSTLTALKLELTGSYGNGYITCDGHTRARQRRSSVELVDAAMQTVRNVLTVLRPNVLDRYGLWEALKEKAAQFQERMRIPCHLSIDSRPLELPSEVSIGVYRVVEEALTNVARHANATRIDVLVRMRGDTLQIAVSDNGRGITKQQLPQS